MSEAFRELSFCRLLFCDTRHGSKGVRAQSMLALYRSSPASLCSGCRIGCRIVLHADQDKAHHVLLLSPPPPPANCTDEQAIELSFRAPVADEVCRLCSQCFLMCICDVGGSQTTTVSRSTGTAIHLSIQPLAAASLSIWPH